MVALALVPEPERPGAVLSRKYVFFIVITLSVS